MLWWKFMDYCTKDGENPTTDWYARQDEDVQAQFDITLRLLAVRRDWTDTQAAQELKKRHAGLWELRFRVVQQQGKTQVKRQFRPVGFKLRSPITECLGGLERLKEPGEFVILLGCEKRAGLYIPAGAFDAALNLKRILLEQKKGAVHEHFL